MISTSSCRSSHGASRFGLSCQPGQPNPYSPSPFVALGVLVVSAIFAMWLVRRDPGLAGRVGSIVADE